MRCDPPLDVFVPVDQDAERVLGIDPGSAIVGAVLAEPAAIEGAFLIYFEGNRYNSANMQRFADKALHAADRMQQSYPTVARMMAEPELLRSVGTFDGGRVDLTDRAALEAWVGYPLDVLQLTVGP